MKIIKDNCLTLAAAVAYIKKKKLDNVIVEKDLFSGKYNILDLE